jgi:hypothetical protein
MYMKASLLALIGLGLCLQAHSENLSTLDGATYNHISAQRVDPDGLYIEYELPGGGMGMSKVKFSRLSPDQQNHFGFDATKAKAFEAQVTKATDDSRKESVRWQQSAEAARAVRQAQDAEIEKARNSRIIARAPSGMADPSGGNNGYGYDYGWTSWGGYPKAHHVKPDVQQPVKPQGIQPPWHPISPGLNPVHK